ncbi:MAG: UDP-N-acetylglucosamine 2-epimerase (non-hydrolyzing) [Oscillospiraceae bacterium]|nr:UDP-N-acetylglucosamine 2-epimerase (non-hydrolyzing) [Oscillospiraceae bacterium]
MKVLSVFGTRPEAVKMCPLVRELAGREGVESRVCLTSQHRELLYTVTEFFGIKADYDLALMRERQTLGELFCGVLRGMEGVLEKERPSLVLVHGDTSTSCAAALAAFYRQIPVGHVEAGLRSGDRYSPFPEEMNRRLTAVLASLHFAPTERNAQNLRSEGIRENIFVTGNTVIDALRRTVRPDYVFHCPALAGSAVPAGRCVLLTAHRRENLSGALAAICRAVLRLAAAFPDTRFIFPVHPNPAVREIVLPILRARANIMLTDPLDLTDMHNLMARCALVLTDSGGLQEEAPALGVPVLVLREETERPEAVDAGTVRLVGTREEEIFRAAFTLLSDEKARLEMARAASPYGDGHASERIADHVSVFLGARRAAG